MRDKKLIYGQLTPVWADPTFVSALNVVNLKPIILLIFAYKNFNADLTKLASSQGEIIHFQFDERGIITIDRESFRVPFKVTDTRAGRTFGTQIVTGFVQDLWNTQNIPAGAKVNNFQARLIT